MKNLIQRFRNVLSNCLGGNFHRLVDRDKRDFFFVALSGSHHNLSSRKLSKANWCYRVVFLLPHSHFVNDLLRLLRGDHKEDFSPSDGNR